MRVIIVIEDVGDITEIVADFDGIDYDDLTDAQLLGVELMEHANKLLNGANNER